MEKEETNPRKPETRHAQNVVHCAQFGQDKANVQTSTTFFFLWIKAANVVTIQAESTCLYIC
jgi:hypothetical protein